MTDSNLYALLIGVNCYLPHRLSDGNYYDNLQGAVNDVNAVENFLTINLNVPESHIFKLTASNPNPVLKEPVEPPEQLPTYANMVAKFKEITEIGQPSDRIYIHYSGHGGRTITAYPEIKGEAGVDESLVPTDIGQLDESGQPVNCYLRDLELALLLKQMEKKGLIVTVVFDSCHSGGATRDKAKVRGTDTLDKMPQKTESLVASREEILDNWRSLRQVTRGESSLHLGSLPQSKDYVFLAACCPSEKAFEDGFRCGEEKRRHGALTYWLLDSLRQDYVGLTYKDIYDRIRAKIQSQFPYQTPMLLGEFDRTVFGRDRTAVTQFLSVQKINPAKQQISINAGIATGIRKGATFAIYPTGSRDFSQTDTRLAIAEVVEYDATVAVCKLEPIVGQREVALGDPVIFLSPPPALVRQVCLFHQEQATADEIALSQLPPNKLTPEIYAKQTQALKSLTVAFHVFGQGWIEWTDSQSHQGISSDDEEIDYLLCINNQEEYEICDTAGLPYKNINPTVKIDEHEASKKITQRLIHLSKYKAVQELYNSASTLLDNLQIKWLGKLYDYAVEADGPPENLRKFQPLDDPLNPTIQEGETIFLEIINLHSHPLRVAILELQSDWAIEQAWPKAKSEAYVEISPGVAHRDVAVFCPSLPEGYQEGVDIIKVFATLGEAELRGLALPALDSPIVAPPGYRGYSGSDPLSLLAEAIAQEKPQDRKLNAAYSYREWVVKQFTVRVKQGE
ncbi:caspase family protein [Laspinema olomoucense]|uniref:Caspase family protein n=1 Tax=Laspinema olomoucense D3b TaxID=2953688 RepID=A0ABT2NB67_9CYAN|nr:caspase family protein [Laspinema sp. D3b]MCT7979802.1 caspase family protein [Laspinema sp. D3b]